MGMGFAPTWLGQVTPPPLHKSTLTTAWSLLLAAGKERSGTAETGREGSAAARLRVSETGEAAVHGATAGQHAQEGREGQIGVAPIRRLEQLND